MAFWLILFFALEWFYPVAFELTPSGATPGKRAFGLKVVMDNGLPVTPAASLTRNLLRVGRLSPVRLRLRDRQHAAAAATASGSATSPPPRWWCTSRGGSRASRSTTWRRSCRRVRWRRRSGRGHRARRARAEADGRAARRTGRAGRGGVRRRRPLRTRRHAPRARRRAVGPGTTLMTPLHFEQMYQDGVGGARGAAGSLARPPSRDSGDGIGRVRRPRRGALPARLRAPRAGARALLPGLHRRPPRAADRRRRIS